MIIHVYTIGRFGPERHIGFVIADDAGCIQETTYVTFDILAIPSGAGIDCIPKGFFTNPLGIGSVRDYRKWKRSQ